MRQKFIVVATVLSVALSYVPFARAQWMQTNGSYGRRVSCFFQNGSTLFAGLAVDGIIRSTDNGANWLPANTGLISPMGGIPGISSFVVMGTNPSSAILFAGTGGGVFISTNGGASWTLPTASLSSASIGDLAVVGTNLFAATYPAGLVVSTDSGKSWSVVNTGFTTSGSALAVMGNTLFFQANKGIERTSDNGTTWDSLNTGGWGNGVGWLTVIGADLFAITGEVFHSPDNGMNWIGPDSGLIQHFVTGIQTYKSNRFASSFGGIYYSSDDGATWSFANEGLADTSVLALAVTDSYVLAGTDSSIWLGAAHFPISASAPFHLSVQPKIP